MRKIKFSLGSEILIAILSLFSVVVVVVFSFIKFSVKEYYTNDAYVVNKLGQIRGSIQRYSKLKVFCSWNNQSAVCNQIPEVKDYIDRLFTTIEKSFVSSEKFSEFKREFTFSETFFDLKSRWNKLKNMENSDEIALRSEICWNIADLVVWKAEKIAEQKREKIIFVIEMAMNGILVFILLLMGAVYFLVRKNLESKVVIDKLTQLYNRHYFDAEMPSTLKSSKKRKSPVSVIVLDIDHFKSINDTFGHTVGDSVLSKVAKILRKQIRDSDFAFRYGGEEFVIVLPNTGSEEAFKVAERIRKAIEHEDFGIKRKVTVSCGVAEYSPGETLEQFIDRADKALYRAKNNGRNRCELAE